MRAQESFVYLSIAATTAAFTLTGGVYQLAVTASWNSGTVTLQQLAPDQGTWLSVSDALTADGGNTLYLPPGQFRLSVSSAVAVYAAITRIPTE